MSWYKVPSGGIQILPVESPIQEIWVLPWGLKSNKCCCKSIGIKCSPKLKAGSDCCQNVIG